MRKTHIKHHKTFKNKTESDTCSRTSTESKMTTRSDVRKSKQENISISSTCEASDEMKTELQNPLKRPAQDEVFSCKLCEKSYNVQHKLEFHINVVHLKRKRYQCPRCEKSYGISQMLRDHVKMHCGNGR